MDERVLRANVAGVLSDIAEGLESLTDLSVNGLHSVLGDAVSRDRLAEIAGDRAAVLRLARDLRAAAKGAAGETA